MTRRKLLWFSLVLAVVMAIAVAGLWLCCKKVLWNAGGVAARKVEVTYIDTSLLDLQRTAYRHWIPDASIHGGGLTRFGSGMLLASGDGRIFFIKEQSSRDTLELRQLAYTVPLNAAQFDSDARKLLGAPAESHWFRVADILAQPRADGMRVFVSHHYWKGAERCFVLRVSVLEGKNEALLAPDGGLAWRTLYDTAPCLELNSKGPRGSRFAGLENGGRMVLLGDEALLLSVGDHEFDGWNREPAMSQDPASSYGKTLLLDADNGAAQVYSLGHRNPQGLDVDAQGVIWSTEHGPRGGDELNQIRRGANYGWPAVTYGAEYGMHRWPLSGTQGRHEGFEKPVFAWVPSGGISQVLAVRSPLFESWHGDLLVAFLKMGRLDRVRVEGGRAMLSEPIKLGSRIRDVVEAADGRIVLWMDEGEISFLAPSTRKSGESLVFQCAGCHALKEWEPSSTGPSLWSVMDRKVASRDDFRYSQAMRGVGGRWTRDRLDAFLANPQAVVPGTTMQSPGIRDAADRARLVDYLETLSR